jgi:hypothetical protein
MIQPCGWLNLDYFDSDWRKYMSDTPRDGEISPFIEMNANNDKRAKVLNALRIGDCVRAIFDSGTTAIEIRGQFTRSWSTGHMSINGRQLRDGMYRINPHLLAVELLPKPKGDENVR